MQGIWETRISVPR